jgi:hypothetical protein
MKTPDGVVNRRAWQKAGHSGDERLFCKPFGRLQISRLRSGRTRHLPVTNLHK